MVRPRPHRKSLEELYATKFEANTLKSEVNNHNVPGTNRNMAGAHSMAKSRADREYANYLLANCHSQNLIGGGGGGHVPANTPNRLATSRRRHERPSAVNPKADKFLMKDDKMTVGEELAKKEHMSKMKTARPTKCGGPGVVGGVPVDAMRNFHGPNQFDNKGFATGFGDVVLKDVHPGQSHGHHRVHQHQLTTAVEDEKDDDTEEFFELIRHTVENAIGKSVNELFVRHFKEMSARIDRFSSELKTTNALLTKISTEVNNKVVHYGEENSRHFRYLCMKSEYDKMFYQHHTMLASKTNLPSPPTEKLRKGHGIPTKSKIVIPPPVPSTNTMPMQEPPCTCRGPKKAPAEFNKSSSEEYSMSNKSSETGMTKVVKLLQRLCSEMQDNSAAKAEDRAAKKTFRVEDMKINKQVFEEEEDEYQLSSDGMTPRSEDAKHGSYGGATTMRTCQATRSTSCSHGDGGGDA